MTISSRVLLVASLMCAMCAFASFAYAVEPYADCTAGYNCTGQTTQTTTSTTQEPYAICVQQKVAAGMSQSAASAACATPAPTYSAAYTACVAQAGLLPASEQEVAKGACMTQHGPTSSASAGTYTTCLEQLAVLGLGSDATAATCRQMYPDSQTTVTTTTTNTNTQTTTPTVASLLAQLAQIQAIIVQLTGASSSGSCEAFSGLSRGMSGEAVTRAQNILITQGHLEAGNNTGFFGPLTEAAVQAFQTAKGIVSSGSPDTTGWGRIGPRTALALGLCS